jgi:predicted dehydrogenase
MNPFQIALIGCGVMGRSLGESLQHVGGAQLAVVCDAAQEQAREAATHFDVPFETNVDAAIGRDGLDGVIVATPPYLHEPPCVAAAERGRHVFVEKPMAPTLDGCDRMIAAAKQGGIRLMVGQVIRYHPIHMRVKQMVDEAAVGRPLFVQIQRVGGAFGGAWAKPWRLTRAQSGGPLLEINAHEIDFMRYLCGEVTQVFAAGGNQVLREADYPDLVLVTMSFASGAVGFLHSSLAYKTHDYGGRIDGTDGSLRIEFTGKDAGIRHRSPRGDEVFIAAADLTAPDPVVAELSAWVASIRDGTDPPVGGADGRATVRIADAAYESVATGVPVRLG